MQKASPANNHHYNKALKEYARALRLNSTKAEIYLWNDVLKKGYLKGYQFHRQRPVLKYIADFMCFELMLVIEVDGITHEIEEVARKDAQKPKTLRRLVSPSCVFLIGKSWSAAGMLPRYLWLG